MPLYLHRIHRFLRIEFSKIIAEHAVPHGVYVWAMILAFVVFPLSNFRNPLSR